MLDAKICEIDISQVKKAMIIVIMNTKGIALFAGNRNPTSSIAAARIGIKANRAKIDGDI